MRVSSYWKNLYAVGTVWVLALLIGGGAGSGLITDTIIQAAVLIAASIVLTSPGGEKIPSFAIAFAGLVVFSGAIQLVPLPSSFLEPFRPQSWSGMSGSEVRYFEPVSLDVGRTIESILFGITALMFTLSVMRLRIEQVYALLPFFFVGVACNGLAGALQYSRRENVAIEGILPFSITAGAFANVNHFSTLMYMSIPLIVFLGRQKPARAFMAVLAILLLLLAAGSRAGVLIGLAVSVLSLAVLFARSRLSLAFVLSAATVGFIYILGVSTKIDLENIDPEFGRREFARTTWEGIEEVWLTGVGYGNFERAYQIYEQPSMIFSSYVNHAHNDYLELVFEGGALAALIIAAYFFLLGSRIPALRNSPFQKAALLSIIFVLIHSLVDYPLRTLALALPFGYLNAVVFHGGFRRREPPEAVSK